MSRTSLIAALATSAAIFLSSCSPDREVAPEDDPFSFVEMKRLALPIGQLDGVNKAETLKDLQSNAPRVAHLYDAALSRLDGIYGDGVGPIKRSPEYKACKIALRGVETALDNPSQPRLEADSRLLWGQLRDCRRTARRWSGLVEMATFGNDLQAMTEGAMLALSYSETAAGSPLGPEIYVELNPTY